MLKKTLLLFGLFIVLCSFYVFGSADSLVGNMTCYYNFDNNLNNSKGGSPATSNSSTYSTGKVGSAHNLTAYTQYIKLCNLTNNAYTTTWSVDFWSYSTYAGTNAVTLNQKTTTASTNNDWFFYDYESDKKMCIGVTGLSQQCSGTNVRNNSVWQYHAYIHYASGNTLIYVNNVLQLNTTANNVIKDLSKQWAYGFFDTSGSQGEVGLIDEMGMYAGYALTQDDRDLRYNSSYGYNPFTQIIMKNLTGIVSYNSTAFANANVSLFNSVDLSLISRTISNVTGGYSFNDLSNNTNYLVLANFPYNYSASSYVLINSSLNFKNLDFLQTTSTSNVTSCVVDNGDWFFVPNGCGDTI